MQVSPSLASSSGQQRQRFWGESPDPTAPCSGSGSHNHIYQIIIFLYISRVIQSMLLPGKYILFRTWSWSAWGIPLAHTVQRWQGQNHHQESSFHLGKQAMPTSCRSMQTSRPESFLLIFNVRARVWSRTAGLVDTILSLSLSLSLILYVLRGKTAEMTLSHVVI